MPLATMMAMREPTPSPRRRRTINCAALEARSGLPAGRRRQARLRVRLPARLETRADILQAILADLSQCGGRVLTDAKLLRGDEVLLDWAGFEAFGEVVWCDHNQCGIAFVEPIPGETILATRKINDAAQLPDDRAMLRQIAAQWADGSRRL